MSDTDKPQPLKEQVADHAATLEELTARVEKLEQAKPEGGGDTESRLSEIERTVGIVRDPPQPEEGSPSDATTNPPPG